MSYAGSELSRQRLDAHVMDEDDTAVEVTTVRPDADALRTLTALVSKMDSIDAKVLAELARRDLVPGIWLPDPSVRGAANGPTSGCTWHVTGWRSRTASTPRSSPSANQRPCRASSAWAAESCSSNSPSRSPGPRPSPTSLGIVDDLEREIRGSEAELRRLGADHPCVPRLMTVPGTGCLLGYTIAAELGDIGRFSSPKKLVGHTGLCPRVYQSGEQDRRGSPARNGPKHLRWALVEGATTQR